MSKKIIHCPACESENLNSSVYCCQCGLPLREGVERRHGPPGRPPLVRPGLAILIALLVGGLIASVVHLYLSRSPDRPPVATKTEATARQGSMPPLRGNGPLPEGASRPAAPAALDAAAPDRPLTTRKQEPPKTARPVVGMVTIFDPWDRQIAALPAAVVNGSWLALPTRACIGGARWLFRSPAGVEIAIEGGLWRPGDGVGLWRLAGEQTFRGPLLHPWEEEEPVHWLSLRTGESGDASRLAGAGREGIFVQAVLPVPLGPGLFMQHGKVVGWTFGDWQEGAYMWNQVPDIELVYENYVEDFYNTTFAGGREELFARALAMDKETPAAERLWAFADAFHLPTRLPAAETPDHLLPESVYPAIRQLIVDLLRQDLHNDIAALAREPLLGELRDAELLIAVVRAMERSEGVEAALDFFEGPGADLRQAIPLRSAALERLHLELYLNAIRDRLDKEDIRQGWRLYSRAQPFFDQSPELHLQAVELALAGRDWAEAERLLYQREYPPDLREKKTLLAGRISELKGLEGRIVINFPPGSRNIPVAATVNDSRRQDFMVDTGASLVTIPTSALAALGLRDKLEDEPQTVQTAGGTVTAPVVVLSSIELQGWVVSDVRALVIDIPEHPGLGLLGLNFLNHFRMDLKPDQGVLLLDPQ